MSTKTGLDWIDNATMSKRSAPACSMELALAIRRDNVFKRGDLAHENEKRPLRRAAGREQACQPSPSEPFFVARRRPAPHGARDLVRHVPERLSAVLRFLRGSRRRRAATR